jgi:cytidylate kinase
MATITISRQFGAGGISLGEYVAKKLDYKFYDRRILHLIAKETEVTMRWVEYFDKEMGSKFYRIVSSNAKKSMIESVTNSGKGFLNGETYMDTLRKIITAIADKGNAVIVGRGSQYILKNVRDVVNILLIAKKYDRIKYLVDKSEISLEQADSIVKNEDIRRSNLYRMFDKNDYDKPFNYHLVINMSKVSKERACKVVCNLAELFS